MVVEGLIYFSYDGKSDILWLRSSSRQPVGDRTYAHHACSGAYFSRKAEWTQRDEG
jgi:hypothetical protein